MFMIMTKVGAYAIVRVYGLVFGADAGPLALAAGPFVLPAALATLVVGTVGLLGSRTLRDLSAFAVIASMGTLLIALGLFDAAAFGFARAGSVLFWASGPTTGERPPPPAAGLAAVLLLLALTVGGTLAAGPAMEALEATARQALDRAAYVGAVLGPDVRLAGGN
jgi:formate hydrogenlyase subunit 3/multisubunit Na+/H+ antiporter MnhD subunit